MSRVHSGRNRDQLASTYRSKGGSWSPRYRASQTTFAVCNCTAAGDDRPPDRGLENGRATVLGRRNIGHRKGLPRMAEIAHLGHRRSVHFLKRFVVWMPNFSLSLSSGTWLFYLAPCAMKPRTRWSRSGVGISPPMREGMSPWIHSHISNVNRSDWLLSRGSV